MKKKLFLSLLVLGFPLVLFAQDIKKPVKPSTKTTEKVSFTAGNTRSPFMSKEDVYKIEAAKKAEKLEQAEAARLEKERLEKERQEMLRKQILCEELKRHPSRVIRESIQIDGILGKDAIVNGEVVPKGKKIAIQLKDTEKAKLSEMEECGFNTKDNKVKVVSVTSDSVWFVYKGERFQVKLLLL